MRRICLVTGSRAEYHLLYPLLKKLQDNDMCNVDIAVTGSHLSKEFGETYKEIEEDGFKPAVKIPILDEHGTETAITVAMSRAIDGFGRYFSENKEDLVVVLGDRYEIMCAVQAAMVNRIPVAHINGGDTTEGAIDESIRHSITKMSYLHFTSCEVYRKRVIQLGEAPERVFNVGALGIDNIMNEPLMTLKELEQSLDIDLSNGFMLVTYHPVTLENNTAEEQFGELIRALDRFHDLKVLLTKANADNGGMIINQMIDDYALSNRSRVVAVFSLGMRRYLTAMKHATIVVGNSSSGIIETPSFKVPTINIGDRQKGRIKAKNIIDCIPKTDKIIESIEMGLSDDFRHSIEDTVNPYGDGKAADRIIEHLREFFCKYDDINIKKTFYDLDFVV